MLRLTVIFHSMAYALQHARHQTSQVPLGDDPNNVLMSRYCSYCRRRKEAKNQGDKVTSAKIRFLRKGVLHSYFRNHFDISWTK